MLAGVFGAPFGGMASDRFGSRKPFLVISAVPMGICIPSFLSLTEVFFFIGLIIAGLAQGVMIPVMLAITIEMTGLGPYIKVI